MPLRGLKLICPFAFPPSPHSHIKIFVEAVTKLDRCRQLCLGLLICYAMPHFRIITLSRTRRMKTPAT